MVYARVVGSLLCWSYTSGQIGVGPDATSKGQILVLASLRRKFGIKEGTRIEIEVDERTQSIVLRPITREYIQSLRGKHKGKGLMKALMAEKKVARES